MALRGKLVVIVGIALAMFGVVAVAVQQFILLPRFTALEEEAAREDMRRCVLAVQREAEYFGRYCLDWAAWDDTYNFVQGRLPSYVQSNLSEATFATRLVTLFYAVRPDGAVAWSRIWGSDDGAASPMAAAFPGETWAPDHPVLAVVAAEGAAHGLMNTPEGPMFVAAQPIVTSLAGSPPAGTLVMGRRIDAELAERLRERAGVPFSIRPVMEAAPSGYRALGGSGEGPVFARPSADGSSLSLYAPLRDFRGEPVFALTATLPRPIFEKGRETMRYTLVTLLLAGALVIASVMGSVQALVVRPLGALARSAAAVRTSGDLSARAEMRRSDELGALAGEFNAMMTRLESDHRSRLASEQLLRNREAELSALFAAAPDAIVTFDTKGRILSANEACRSNFGYGADALMGRKVTSLIPELPLPEDSAPRIAGAMPGTKDDDGRELAGVRADGTGFPVHVRVNAVRGDAAFFVAIIRDIAALKRLHEEMAQSRHLAEIGEMSASIAHEIRNPLAGISSVLQVFRDGLDRDDPRREVLAEVFGQIRRLDGAVHNLLMFARPWTPELQPCAVAALAEEAIANARKKPEFADIAIELTDASGGAVAPADRLLMNQVLWNVLENAAQAVEGRGAIRCTVERENGFVRTRIRDTGRGLAPGAEAELFRPFYTTRTRGTGLGLPVCRRIMAAHGGSIAIANHREGGAEVALLLPTGTPHGRERTDS